MKVSMKFLLVGLALAGWLGTGCATRSGSGAETSTGLPYRPPEWRVTPRYGSSFPAPTPATALAVKSEAKPVGPTVSGGTEWKGKMITDTDWRMAAGDWLGTPYRTGGETRAGADCSGFVKTLYRELPGFNLPRTTALQWQQGRPVSPDQLRSGDLVFFSGGEAGDGVNHVGVIIGPGEFAHASTSRGVRFDSYDRGYWQKRWMGSRRFLP
jgi:cell wall-associated NlpC family hydrolase